MFKTRSYKLVDAIANHPDVRPTIEQGDHYVSSAELLSNPCLLYTSPSPRDGLLSRMPSSA